uniref:Uncharacterized protein n=1 Tax=Arundo donax TaxID=35708 RepID=A0A0A9A630_ARUDO
MAEITDSGKDILDIILVTEFRVP